MSFELRSKGRWAVAVVVCVLSLLPALVLIEIAPDLERSAMSWLDALGLRAPGEVTFSLATLVIVGAVIACCMLAATFSIGYAMRTPMRTRVLLGLTLTIVLVCLYRWLAAGEGEVAARVVAVIVAVLVISGLMVEAVRKPPVNVSFFAIGIGAVLLTLPEWIGLLTVPPEPGDAQKIWSVVLERNLWQGTNTQSAFESRRQVVFAGDRLVASFEESPAPYEGNQPMANYRLVSLDLRTGAEQASKEFLGVWAHTPTLYATKDGRVNMQHESLKSLNADLSEAGPEFRLERGHVGNISPDGSTMAWETMPGSTLLDAEGLAPMGVKLEESVPTSMSAHAVVTDNIYWVKDYPQDRAFVTLVDEQGKHLLFHGECGGRPEFLSNEKVLVAGCRKIRIVDTQGKLLVETKTLEGAGTFAGASQDGRRFAMEYSIVRGDPPMPLYNHFVIYETESAKPLAIVRIRELPEYYSWAAFSPDGKLFAAGSPSELSLYRVP